MIYSTVTENETFSQSIAAVKSVLQICLAT